jgi:prophage regulatory protein
MPTPVITRCIRREELRRLVPLSDTTIYEMERRGEFPRRFNLTPRCVAWSFDGVQAWLAARRDTAPGEALERAPSPDVYQRRTRPVRVART